jgi:hypothetical protein
MDPIFETNSQVTRRQKRLTRAWVITALIVAFGNSGCSMGKPPSRTLASAELALRSASEAKAADFALIDFRNARDKLERSKQAMADKNYDHARRLAEHARVDAELAEARAEAEILRQVAEELRKSIHALRMDAQSASRK